MVSTQYIRRQIELESCCAPELYFICELGSTGHNTSRPTVTQNVSTLRPQPVNPGWTEVTSTGLVSSQDTCWSSVTSVPWAVRQILWGSGYLVPFRPIFSVLIFLALGEPLPLLILGIRWDELWARNAWSCRWSLCNWLEGMVADVGEMNPSKQWQLVSALIQQTAQLCLGCSRPLWGIWWKWEGAMEDLSLQVYLCLMELESLCQPVLTSVAVKYVLLFASKHPIADIP